MEREVTRAQPERLAILEVVGAVQDLANGLHDLLPTDNFHCFGMAIHKLKRAVEILNLESKRHASANP